MHNTIAYRSTRTLSLTVAGLLAASAITDAINLLLTFGEAYFPYPVTLDQGESMSIWLLFAGLWALIRLPVFILTVVFFLIWLNRSYKNLTPLGARQLEHTSGWAVGYWFIPFVSLFKPFQVVRETWKKSAPNGDPQFGFTDETGTPGLLGTWWALWILSTITANVSVLVEMMDNKETAPVAMALSVVSDFLSVLAAIAAIMVVRGITSRQQGRYEKAGNLFVGQEPPPPPTFG
jgi:Domain of unknown function (DUF4328)